MSATQDEIFRRFMQDPRDACDEYATNQALRDLERGRSALLEKKLAEAEQKLTAQNKAIDELRLALTNAERAVERGRMKDAQFVCPHCGEELKSRWIPVSERLPEEDGAYVVSVIRNRPIRFPDWETRDVYECVYSEAGWHTANDVVAWMPLPEPYKED